MRAYFVRRGIDPACGYYLDDSGPVFPAPDGSSHSRPLHDQIRGVWGLDSVFEALPATFDRDDLGSINRIGTTNGIQRDVAG